MNESNRHRWHAEHMLFGELLAERCSEALAAAMPDPRLRRAYARQARDERRHAALFRARLGQLGVDPSAEPRAAAFEGYRALCERAMARGQLVHLVVATNVVLEGVSSVAFRVSGDFLAARGRDPEWVSIMRTVEHDERRHMRLGLPALRALAHAQGGGGDAGALPREAAEVLGEVREAGIDCARALADPCRDWSIDPVLLFDLALRHSQGRLLSMIETSSAQGLIAA